MSLAVADVNGDGKLDLILSSMPGCVAVLLGSGEGTFQPAVCYYSGEGYEAAFTTSVAVADVNGDGRPDIVVANECDSFGNCATGAVGVLLGNGDGTFQRVVTYDSGGYTAMWVAIEDVNGDGKPDLVVANCSPTGQQCGVGLGEPTGLVGVLLGNGDGTFQPVVTYGSGGTLAAWIAIADVNGDGKPDLLVVNLNSSTVGVLLGNGDGTFHPAVTFSTIGPYATSVAVADVNGDSKPDLVVANECGTYNNCSATVSVLLGNGDGTFQWAVNYDVDSPQAASVAVADLDGDGKTDLVVSAACGTAYDCLLVNGPGSVGVLLGNGDGTFQPVESYDTGGYRVQQVVVADVNLDGKPDLLVANFCSTSACLSSGSVGVLLNNTGPGNLTTTALASPVNPSVYGQTVPFTAQVTASSGTPTGTVILLDGSAQVGSGTLTNGSVSIPVSSLPAGANSMTAKYQGSTGFAPSTSAPLTQTVSLATTTMTLASSLNPAATNQPVTFTATVSSQYGGAATGSVVFFSGSQTLGTVSLNGNTASLTTSFSAVGTYSISAKYNGDGNNTGSTSSTLSQVIIASTTITLVSSLNPSVVGQAVTFTATVSSSAGAPPNGETITFKNGSAILGTGTLGSGMASLTTSSLLAGIYTITASYPGDANFAASTSPGLRQVVNSTTKSVTQRRCSPASIRPSTVSQLLGRQQ